MQEKHGQFAFLWTFSTSPLIHNDTLYMQVLQRDTKVSGKGSDDNRSYLLALDPKTGKQLWKTYDLIELKSSTNFKKKIIKISHYVKRNGVFNFFRELTF